MNDFLSILIYLLMRHNLTKSFIHSKNLKNVLQLYNNSHDKP